MQILAGHDSLPVDPGGLGLLAWAAASKQGKGLS